MKKYLTYILYIVITTLITIACTGGIEKSDWSRIAKIKAGIVEPRFLDKEYNILDYGAVGDSVTDCTEAIKRAIEECTVNGGGRVLVPGGVFSTGPVHMKNNVNLHIEEGGTLLFSRDLSKYLPLVETRFEGNDLMNYSPLIYARGVKNIAVTGKGRLDGNADRNFWWPWKGNEPGGWKEGMPSQHNDRKRLVEMANQGIPIRERLFGEGHYLRVNFIQFIDSKNILIRDVTIVNSPMWEIHPVLCQHVTVSGVRIESHGPNNDGCNPESCRNMLIENCYFDTGDDCIAIKSGREGDGRRLNVPSENIIITGCRMKDGHGGVVIGSEISGGCRNIYIENCEMDSPNLDRALRIKSNSLRGGLIENIYMRNVKVGEVREAVILIDLYYDEGDVGAYAPVVQNVYIDGVQSERSRYALLLKGYDRSPVRNIRLYNCTFNGVSQESILCNVEGLKALNTFINGNRVKRRPEEFCSGEALSDIMNQTNQTKY